MPFSQKHSTVLTVQTQNNLQKNLGDNSVMLTHIYQHSQRFQAQFRFTFRDKFRGLSKHYVMFFHDRKMMVQLGMGINTKGIELPNLVL